MIQHVIPINYFGGSGGQFLSSFLYSAREKEYNQWHFSEAGRAHDSEKDWIPQGSNDQNVIVGILADPTGEKNLNLLLTYAERAPKNKVTYPMGHFANPDEILKYFDKQIKIYFEPEHEDEIIGVMMSKVPEHFPGKLVNPTDSAWIHRKSLMNRFLRLRSNAPDLEPRLLNISWNEMVYLDPDILVSKLSNFTQIPKENFDKERFIIWRNLTLITINKLNLQD